MDTFKINFLDHVAIRVKDLELSANWYEKVLGLKKYQLPAWGPFPIFLLSGKSGIALFPLSTEENTRKSIDHFAFNVDQENFALAKQKFTAMGINYDFQDHHYFHSIYLKDPDGHIVELTSIVVAEDEFY